MTEKSDKDRILENQDTLAKIIGVVGKLRRNTPPPLEREGSCYLRCPHCKRCLKWREEDGTVKELWLPIAYFHDERVRTLCPRCNKPLDRYGTDPEHRNPKNIGRLFVHLKDRRG